MNPLDSSFDKSAVESLILASPEPISSRKIIQVMEELTPSGVGRLVAELNERYADSGVSFRIREIAGGYQFYILPEYVGYVEELFARRRKLRLTRAALETASIVAYRQPVTKAEIEHIRGVASDGVLNNLLEKKLVTITGRAETVGKPLQYGTTDEFLKFFGLNSIKDLPKMAEIEELIAASEKSDQTELTLIRDGEEEMVKLNVADGTFDPKTRVDDEDELVPLTEEPITDSLDSEASDVEATQETSDDHSEEITEENHLDRDDEMEIAEPSPSDSSELSDQSDEESTARSNSSANRLVLKDPVPQGTFGPVGSEEESDELSQAD